MQKTVYKIAVLVLIMLCVYLYYIIFSSSLSLENSKALFNRIQLDEKTHLLFVLKITEINKSRYFDTVSVNPAEIELFLRAQLIENSVSSQLDSDIWWYYEFLLKKRPTWPYLHSGLAQSAMQRGVVDELNLRNAIKFGPHEVKIIKSLAEILFYSWEKMQKESRLVLLNYLTEQNKATISRVVNISARFAKIYAYCDFIYEKKHVEYAACKDQYWQPLDDM